MVFVEDGHRIDSCKIHYFVQTVSAGLEKTANDINFSCEGKLHHLFSFSKRYNT